MKIINLLPKEEQRQLKLDIANHQLRVFWIVVFCSLLVLGVMGVGTQQYLRLSVKRIEQDIAQNQAKLETADIKVLQQQVLQLNQNIRELKNVRGQQHKWSEVLLELSRVIPSDVQINSVLITRATGEVIIVGRAQNRDVVIETWSQLKKSPMFADVNFPLPNLEQPINGNFTYTFFINLENIEQNELEN